MMELLYRIATRFGESIPHVLHPPLASPPYSRRAAGGNPSPISLPPSDATCSVCSVPSLKTTHDTLMARLH